MNSFLVELQVLRGPTFQLLFGLTNTNPRVLSQPEHFEHEAVILSISFSVSIRKKYEELLAKHETDT
jgi:hypothetical protein